MRRLAWLVFAALVLAVSLAQADPLVRAVGAIGITVSDLDAAVRFYETVLDFEKVSEREVAGTEWERLQGVFPVRMRVARLALGTESIELTEYLAPRGRPMPADTRGSDRWFQHIAIVISDMDRAYARLRKHRVAHASSGPQRLPDWNPNAGGIEAFYFRDPDGHFLELIRFPAGKGDPRWQAKSRRLLLSMDHTAITVADTDVSLRFYRDALGLRVAGASENYGIEQERLNAVVGARLRITALRAAEGPGIELLEYLAPGGGRPRPPTRARTTSCTGRPTSWCATRSKQPCGFALAAARGPRPARSHCRGRSSALAARCSLRIPTGTRCGSGARRSRSGPTTR